MLTAGVFEDGLTETSDEIFERAALRAQVWLLLVSELDLDWTDGQDMLTPAKDQSLSTAKLCA